MTRTTLTTTPDGRRTEDRVKLDKKELVRVLRTEGDNGTADQVEARLPDEIDTDRDGDALAEVGLDRTQLMSKLAGGGFGTTLTP
ncbi:MULTISPECIES: hypothetical protein [unclassified Blastococcus]